MATENEAIKVWRASVPAGICPSCKEPVPPPKKPGRERWMCDKPKCRKEYLAVRQRGTRPPTFLRSVESTTPVEDSRGRVLVKFSPCGHTEELPRSKVKPGWRRKCQECERLSKSGASAKPPSR